MNNKIIRSLILIAEMNHSPEKGETAKDIHGKVCAVNHNLK